jgi:hypothetical protein
VDCLAIWIAALTRIERDGLPHRNVDLQRSRSDLAVHDDHRIVVRMFEVGNRPRHTSSEIILKCLPPAPDCGLV